MNNRVCKVCGTAYYYCPSCHDNGPKENWKILCHDENCMKIFNVCSEHFFNRLTDTQAMAELEKLDLTNLETFNETNKKQIKEILATKKTRKIATRKAVKEPTIVTTDDKE